MVSFMKHEEYDYLTIEQESKKATKAYQDSKVAKPLPKLKELRVKHANSTYINTEYHFVLSIYLNYPPLRGDLFKTKFRNYNKTEHHYDNGCIVIPKCIKTKKETVIELEDKDIKLIETIIENKKDDDDFLITMKVLPRDIENRSANSGNPGKYLSRVSMKYFGQKLTVNDFRHMSVDDNEDQCKGLSNKEAGQKRVALAEKMCHSVITQQKIYNNGEKKVEEAPRDKIKLLMELREQFKIEGIYLDFSLTPMI
jgi:hypothetical protein